LKNEISENIHNVVYTADYFSLSIIKPNRSIKDELLIGDYKDLNNNLYSFTPNKIKEKIFEIDDFTGDEVVVNYHFNIIDRIPFHKGFCYIIQNEEGFSFRYYRIKSLNATIISVPNLPVLKDSKDVYNYLNKALEDEFSPSSAQLIIKQ
jgi:hypothetical protein